MLTSKQCAPCNGESQALSSDQQMELIKQLADWQRVVRNDVAQLEKSYRFKNFKLAWAFSNQVAELAEEEFHHPTIVLEWGKVTVTWWSHSLKGLHENDFICAAKCDALFDSNQG
ncbi:4a-hydroxytetrahydrobiopterin dehydratase [Vibrio sp. LaRot3]|uniref:4a-hydroxytetrahydrobiopterin dehydratase n=1 Tax=Vibrio sp. LaRot3 TaxID=2998829 RepID=UPI0022CE17A4|nr:4a-hydroxytetrahydrobiopterin dehydratase [Vibrio sp. LaRot3]MDA0148150.1 4a-hydroxytetrahydrobiopterin dehydratase [Vibrio sp. LaRot3]